MHSGVRQSSALVSSAGGARQRQSALVTRDFGDTHGWQGPGGITISLPSDDRARNQRRDLWFSIIRETDTVVVVLDGNLDLARAAQLGAALADLIDGQGNLRVVVDLEHVDRVDPAALGTLAVAAMVAELHGGHLAVRGASEDLLDALDTADLAGMVTAAGGNGNHPGSSSTVSASSVRADAGRCRHVVEFYESHRFLVDSVRDYIAPALGGDDGIIVVAMPDHRGLFGEVLRDAGVDLDRAQSQGRYVDLDAEETLSLFMVDGQPKWPLFEKTIGLLISQVTAGNRTVRIYDEMVALLWADGNAAGAMCLEDLWNNLGRLHDLSLFCAYPVTAFDSPGTAGSLRRLCEQHAIASPEKPTAAHYGGVGA